MADVSVLLEDLTDNNTTYVLCLLNSSMSKTSSSEEVTEDACPGRVCPPKRMKLIDSDGPLRIANRPDNRQWTTLHKEVANVNNRTVSSLSVLTPPQEGQESTAAQNSNVNAVGPGGITPLMLAASRGSYLDEVCEDGNSDDSGSQVTFSVHYSYENKLQKDFLQSSLANVQFGNNICLFSVRQTTQCSTLQRGFLLRFKMICLKNVRLLGS